MEGLQSSATTANILANLKLDNHCGLILPMNLNKSLHRLAPSVCAAFSPSRKFWRETFVSALLLLTPLLLSLGCTPRERDAPSPQLQTVVAAWDGGKLTLGEWLHSFRELESPDSFDSQKLGDSVLQLCHEWVSEKVLTERAKEAGMHQDPKMVEKLGGLREDRLITLFLREMVDEHIVVKKADLKTFYEENQDRFKSPATYSYYRIFFSNQKDGKEEAKRRAQECWSMIDKGANFHEMLAQFSDTPEPEKNQIHGPFSAGELPTEIEKVMLDTPLRHQSAVLERSGGYVILYPETKTEPVVRDYNSVEKVLYEELFTKEQTTRVEALLKELQGKYQVTLHKELFDEAEVKPDALLLEINPGGVLHTWGEFQNFAKARQETGSKEKEDPLELFARRMLLLNHTKQIKFADTEYFRKRFRPLEARVLSDFFIESMVDSKVSLTEEEIQEYYEKNPDEFRRPARIETWHLTKKLRFPVNASEKDRTTEEQKVFSWLMQIRQRIAEQGESFVTWASRFTDYEDGGYLGWQSMLAMPPQWISVVATLEEGEISMPIRIKDTFELVLRGGIEDAGVLKFDVAHDKVKEQAKRKKVAEARRQYLESLLLEIGVNYNVQPAVDLVVRLLDRTNHPPQYWLDPYQ